MACEEGRITIPQDIIIDILCCLPVKFVGRFRCVSKEWLFLLSDPEFIKTYQKTRNRNHLIFYSGSLYTVPFDNHEAVSTLKEPLSYTATAYIYGSCNGLVLAYHLQAFVVLNQTTREYVQFLDVRHVLSDSTSNQVYRSNTGFGYDSLSDDYKVVRISRLCHPDLIQPAKDIMCVYVYSLRSNTWRRVSDSPYEHFYGAASSGVFVNGRLHWVGRKGSDVVLAAFSLADEKFIEVPSPVLYNDAVIMSDKNCKLVALGEKLAIFHEWKGVVWLMNEYGITDSWTKILLCGFNKIPMSKFKAVLYDIGKLLIVRNDLIWIYDLEEGTLCETVDISNLNLWWVESAYVESLVSPKLDRDNQIAKFNPSQNSTENQIAKFNPS